MTDRSHSVLDELAQHNPVPVEGLGDSWAAPGARHLLSDITSHSRIAAPPPWDDLSWDDPIVAGGRFRSIRTPLFTAASLAACAALVVGILSLSAGSPSKNAASTWALAGDITSVSWNPSTGAGYQSGASLECPSSSTCYATVDPTGSPGPFEIEVSHDGGATWQQSALPAGVGSNGPIDCVSATNCETIGVAVTGKTASYSLLMTNDGGATWTEIPFGPELPPDVSPTDVSCTTATSCFASFISLDANGTGVVMATSNGGRTWTSSSTLPPGFQPLAVECFTGGHCIVTGDRDDTSGMALYSTDGGTSWVPATVPARIGLLGLDSLSCESGSECLALTTASATGASPNVVAATTDGGVTWTLTSDGGLPSGAQPYTLSCALGGPCWIGGWLVTSPTPQLVGGPQPSLLAMSTDGGQTWQASQLASSLSQGAVTSVSCPDATSCYAMEMQGNESGHAMTAALLSYGS